MKILVTGFDPFGGEKINPAFEVIKALPNEIEGAEIIKLEVPTAFYTSIERTIKEIEDIKPNIVLCIGQAGGRFNVSIEKVAININDARISDNLRQQPIDEFISEEGETAYFATLPVKAIVAKIREKNIPAAVSYTAGTYVCNHLMYGVLNYIHKNKLDIKAGFIHIPFLLEQVMDKQNIPAMSLETMVIAIETAISVIATTKVDVCTSEGSVF